MLKLRFAQMEHMSRAVRGSFERRMAERLRESFPEECRAMGEGALAETIQEGVSRATSYGIDRSNDVALYLHLVIAFGPAFDSEPWAREILRDPELPEGARRVQRLYGAAMERQGGTGHDH